MDLSSQVSEGSTSLPNGWGGRTSSTSSATRSVGKSSPITSPNPNPSTMSKPSMQLRFEDVYESFRVASPASPLVQQESGPARPTIDIYGRRCLESFMRLAPPMSWRRMFAASLVGMKGWFSTRCALTWKVKDTKSSRSYFLLQASTRRTDATECGSWLPTPVAWDGNGGGARKPKDGKANALGYSLTLKDRAAAKMLPTPNTRDHRASRALDADGKSVSKKGVSYGVTLAQQAKSQMLPTPMAQEHDKITGKENQDSLTKRARQQSGKTSRLSALFVEEMMGFPKGWTASPFQSGDENQ